MWPSLSCFYLLSIPSNKNYSIVSSTINDLQKDFFKVVIGTIYKVTTMGTIDLYCISLSKLELYFSEFPSLCTCEYAWASEGDKRSNSYIHFIFGRPVRAVIRYCSAKPVLTKLLVYLINMGQKLYLQIPWHSPDHPSVSVNLGQGCA